jgi:methylenetetrahydrofolate reductase (NADPH)
MPENKLRSALENKDFFCSAELVMGRDHTVPEAETFVRDASNDPNGIRIISITDLPGGNPALPPEAFASFILEHGLTPLAHLAGKDGNRAFLEARLLTFARMGVESILALTGDAQKEGYRGRSKPVYDFDSIQILSLANAMKNGIEYKMGSRQVKSTPFGFLAGAVVNPYKTTEADQMMQFYKLHLKIAAGAAFIITQLGYNLRKLYELKQYMHREGLDATPVVANVYVPTATIARMMRDGEVAGCVIPEELIQRLEKEKKPERLERAALMVAAARDLGFSGVHVGGFRLSHADFITILGRADAIGRQWRNQMDQLVFPYPDEYYLLPQAADGLSDAFGGYQLDFAGSHLGWMQRLSRLVHDRVISEKSFGGRFLAKRLGVSDRNLEDDTWRSGFWYNALGAATLYREAVMGCVKCGDCIQDYLNYAGCTMRWCYKGLGNGPCGGSRVDGSCEAYPERTCRWSLVYKSTMAAGEKPEKFAHTEIPPREWRLDLTNALANRLAHLDNLDRRRGV